MKWGLPSDYVYLLKFTPGECSYKRRLLYWLETENPQLLEMVKKELARDSKTLSQAPQGAKQKAAHSRIPATDELEDSIQELGNDLLARGD